MRLQKRDTQPIVKKQHTWGTNPIIVRSKNKIL